jgi:hypothetical protein
MQTHSDAQAYDGGKHLAADALKGAVAGAAAVWVLDRVDWFMFNHEDPETRERTREVRPDGLDPSHTAAKKAATAVGKELTPSQPNPLGIGIHYNLGIAPGALYGVLHERVPMIGTGRGLLWGLGLFLVQDEMVNAALGLSGRLGQYPWQDHARGLIAHLAYGIALDAGVRALKKGPHSAYDPARLN